jgi:hypothetical protein
MLYRCATYLCAGLFPAAKKSKAINTIYINMENEIRPRRLLVSRAGLEPANTRYFYPFPFVFNVKFGYFITAFASTIPPPAKLDYP